MAMGSKDMFSHGAIASLKRAAKRNDPSSVEWLGILSRDGQRDKRGKVLVRRDLRAAKHYFRRAAELGNPYAMVAYADQLSLPGSRTLSLREAMTWYRRAFRLGETIGAHNLAVTYQNQGRLRLAVRWFRRAIRAGDASSELPLALAEMYGSGTRRDPRSAVRRLSRVARGEPRYVSQAEQEEAMLTLALAYDQGWLLRRDHAMAITWLRRAAKLGSDAANALLRDLCQEPRR